MFSPLFKYISNNFSNAIKVFKIP